MMLLSERLGVELPITNAVYNILYKSKAPADEIFSLFERKSVSEFIL